MKRSGKITAFILSVTTVITMLSSGFSPSAVSAEEQVYERYAMADLEAVVKKLQDDTAKPDNEDEVRNDYDLLIREYDRVDYELVLAEIQYSESMTEENLNEYTIMAATEQQARNIINSALLSALKTEYMQVISELVTENLGAESIQETDLKTEKLAAEALQKKNDLYQKFIEILGSEMSGSEKDLASAELYLETVKFYNSLIITEGYNYIDYAYQQYGRDYSPEDISSMNDAVAGFVSNSAEKLAAGYSEYDLSNLKDIVFENNMDVIEQFSYRVSDELKASAEELRNRGLYRTGSSDQNSEQKSYTAQLSYIDSAIIFQYLYNNYSDLSDAVHEFGHFNAMRACVRPAYYITQNNLDIAEVQSQGLEALYTNYYDSIYGADADFMKLVKAQMMLSSLAAGFLGNEFEWYVYQNADSMTPQDVVDKYNELIAKYHKIYDTPLHQVPHFFQMPGYYISYGVSGLAALDLWDVMYRDYDRAVEMYTNISHVSIYDGTGFSYALEETGFDDVMSAEFVSEKLPELMDVITSGLVYGDTDLSGSVNVGDIVFLSSKIMSPDGLSEDYVKSCDLSCDGKVNAADIIVLKRIIGKR